MHRNPVALIRKVTAAAAVLLVIAFVTAILAGIGPSGLAWAWIIGGILIGLSILSFLTHLAYPEAADIAWDEMNRAAHRASLIFGYWAALAAFLILLALVWRNLISAQTAFFWLGPVLGIGPSVHFLASILRGRAD